MAERKKYLEIGKITSIVGLKGEVRVYPMCDSPELLCEFGTLYWKSGTPVTVEKARVQKNMAVLKLEGVDTPEAAQKLRNHVLYMDRDDVELEEGSWFIADLIGLEVRDAKTGEVYGTLSDVTETGANDVYHIKTPDGRTLLAPAIPDVVDSIDLDGGVMLITPLDGLFDI
ncbi:16S rRNA processing protein RimM [Ruminococcus sp. YE71]|uniref:ribosome maturation factor RimM n=1 Tax=unclassified Ruminococcus TaxID=2608920 RepID=UPI000886868D|nr:MULTISPECIES: ribosome maturation factor RimM [unclassified Ruminococcus]SDA10343.1 16S rRNA processing protein RimM [Ruminococcus sp. YE78]SFW10797.1 16S rRNA processing protein RimM [Ruminococcus sp. YE71]